MVIGISVAKNATIFLFLFFVCLFIFCYFLFYGYERTYVTSQHAVIDRGPALRKTGVSAGPYEARSSSLRVQWCLSMHAKPAPGYLGT